MNLRVHGWRRSGIVTLICMFLLTATMVGILAGSKNFAANKVWDAYADKYDGDSNKVIYAGTCDRTTALNMGLHLLINAVSTLMLASRNFFMQILCSPTRSDLDEAHRNHKVLEIGVHSPMNLLRLPFLRSLGWLLLAFTSLSLHVVFNSVVTETKASTNLHLVIASESFIQGGNFITFVNAPLMCGSPEAEDDGYIQESIRETLLSIAGNASGWDYVAVSKCYERYTDPYRPAVDYRHVVLIVSNRDDEKTVDWTLEDDICSDASLIPVINRGRGPTSMLLREELWRSYNGISKRIGDYVGTGLPSIREWEETRGLFEYYTGADFDPATGHFTFGLAGWQREYANVNPGLELKVRYCLSEPVELQCEILVIDIFFMAVTIACAIKFALALAILTLHDRSNSSLVLLGDAIQSFLRKPDACTSGKCLWSKTDFTKPSQENADPRAFHNAPRRLREAVTMRMWCASYIFTVALCGIWIAVLVLAAQQVPMYVSSAPLCAISIMLTVPTVQPQGSEAMSATASILLSHPTTMWTGATVQS